MIKTHGTKDDYVTYVLNPHTYEMVYLNMQDIIEHGIEKYQFDTHCEELGIEGVTKRIHDLEDYLRNYGGMIRDALVDIDPVLFGGLRPLTYHGLSVEPRRSTKIGDISKYQIYQDGDEHGLDITFYSANSEITNWVSIYVGLSLADDFEKFKQVVVEQVQEYHRRKQEFLVDINEKERQARLKTYIELSKEFGVDVLLQESPTT